MALTDFIQACDTNDLAAMQASLVDLDAQAVDGTRGRTALAWAAINGNQSIVEQLLAVGAPVNRADADGRPPLMFAAIKGHSEIIPQLLAAGADVNCTDQKGWTPLIAAASFGRQELIAMLLRAGAGVNHVDHSGYTPLLHATLRAEPAIASQLLAVGAEVNCADPEGWTPLIWAATNGNKDMVRLLIEQSALNRKDQDGRTALDCALESEEWGCADLLAIHDPQFEHLEWPRQATPADLPQWHARLEQKALQNALQEQSSALQGDSGPNSILAQKNARKQRL